MRNTDPRRTDPAEEGRETIPVVTLDMPLKAGLIGMFLLMTAAALYFGRDFLLPVSLAFLFGLVLSPVVRSLKRRGIPEWMTAILLVVAVGAGIASGLYYLSGPVSKWIEDAPTIGRELHSKFADLRQPVEAVTEATKQVEKAAETEDPEAERVVLSEPGLLSRAASGAPEVVAQIGVTLVLLLFLLSSGDMFYEKLVKTLPTLTDRKMGVRIARTVEREVSRYLFTITLINAGLGVAVGTSMALIGMPSPLLWGILAALLNFIPYIGALIGVALAALIGVITYDSVWAGLLPPLIYLVLTMVEGQLVTPLTLGRRLEMNPVAIFLAIAFWGWLWGIVGALIAVPLLLVVKVFADHVEGLSALGEFLAARDLPKTADDGEEK